MPKSASKNPALINDPQRCEICATILTLYPHNFGDCPHCGRKVCRSCWGDAWAQKSIPAENCAHSITHGRLGGSNGPSRVIQWDWRKALFVGILSILAFSILYFLWSQFF